MMRFAPIEGCDHDYLVCISTYRPEAARGVEITICNTASSHYHELYNIPLIR